MVELPTHVRANPKPGGRVYYTYAKHRGTPSAWPPVALPPDPLSEDFARRVAQCGRLVARNEGGQWMWAFTDAIGHDRTLPAPKPNDVFWAAVDKAEKIGKQLAAGERKTFAALIADYKDHHAYTKKIAPSTRAGYDRYLDLVEAAWGDDPVASLTSVDAQKAIDEYKNTPAAARYFRAVLSRVIKWGIPRGYTTFNPITNTEKIEGDGTYAPWPSWAFELFFEEARPDLHLPVFSGLFTGQRSVDVMKMRRPLADATEMPLVAQKTSDLIPVQIASEYRAIIKAAKADNVMLHVRADGEAWTMAGFKTAWQRQMDRDAFKRFREERLVFHGLRKNAVNMLLEVGCSEAQVGAIVGMSPQMVAHYSKAVSKFRLARGAMKVLEEGWGAHRVAVLGTVKQAK